MKITITVKKEEVESLRFWSKSDSRHGDSAKQLLEKIEKQIAYNKKKEAYDKQVKDVMGDTIEKIEKHKFVIEER